MNNKNIDFQIGKRSERSSSNEDDTDDDRGDDYIFLLNH